MDQDTFKSNNGDTLKQLSSSQGRNYIRTFNARQKLSAAEVALRPLRDEVERSLAEEQNLSTRLLIWWNEFRSKGGKAD